MMKANLNKMKSSIILSLCFVLMPITASANMVWPSLYIVKGLSSWYIILSGLVIEFTFIKIFAKQTYLKSIFISFIMNMISTVVGFVLIPVSGIIGEFMLMPFGGGTFALSHWILSYILAVFSNVLIEGLSIRYIFKLKKFFWWLLFANAISVIICILAHGFTLDNISI